MEQSFIEIKNKVIEVLKTCYDPEIPVDVYELGLIYEVNVSVDNNVQVLMTLTSPNCPVAESLPAEIKHKIEQNVPGIGEVKLDITFDPPWEYEMMSETAKFELGFL